MRVCVCELLCYYSGVMRRFELGYFIEYISKTGKHKNPLDHSWQSNPRPSYF